MEKKDKRRKQKHLSKVTFLESQADQSQGRSPISPAPILLDNACEYKGSAAGDKKAMLH